MATTETGAERAFLYPDVQAILDKFEEQNPQAEEKQHARGSRRASMIVALGRISRISTTCAQLLGSLSTNSGRSLRR